MFFFQKKIPRVSSGDGTTFSPPKKVSEEKHHLWPSEETGFAMNVPLGFLHHIEKKKLFGGWTKPFEKYANHEIGSFPQGSGVKIPKSIWVATT